MVHLLKSASEKPSGQCIGLALKHKCGRGKLFYPQRGVPSYYWRKRQGEADSKTGRVFREQTEGSPDVWRQALMSLSNEVERERGKHSPSSVWLPSSQQDIKYSISTPSLVIWWMKLDSINTLSCKYRINYSRKEVHRSRKAVCICGVYTARMWQG